MQLPTLTVTDAQGARIQAAFGTVQNYKNWLLGQVVAYVKNSESEATRSTILQETEATEANVDADLGTIDPTV